MLMRLLYLVFVCQTVSSLHLGELHWASIDVNIEKWWVGQFGMPDDSSLETNFCLNMLVLMK